MGQIFTRPLRKTKKTAEHAARRAAGEQPVVEPPPDGFEIIEEHVDKDGTLCRVKSCPKEKPRAEVEGER